MRDRLLDRAMGLTGGYGVVDGVWGFDPGIYSALLARFPFDEVDGGSAEGIHVVLVTHRALR